MLISVQRERERENVPRAYPIFKTILMPLLAFGADGGLGSSPPGREISKITAAEIRENDPGDKLKGLNYKDKTTRRSTVNTCFKPNPTH